MFDVESRSPISGSSQSCDDSEQNRYEVNLLVLRRTVFLAALVALSVVGIYSVARGPRFRSLPNPTSDGPIYENIAFHLASGRGFWIDWHNPSWRSSYEQSADREAYVAYLGAPPQSMPTTGRPPLFPALVALIYELVGRGPSAFAWVRVLSALCIAAAGAIAVSNAATLLTNRVVRARALSRWSVLAGCAGATVLAASNRTLIGYADDFLTEPLALLMTQLFVAGLLAICQHFHSASEVVSKSDTRAMMLLSLYVAATLAAMVLARSLFVLWIPGVALLLFKIWPTRNSWRWVTVIMTVTILLLMPWWVRNCMVLGRLMPLGTQGPITMLGGYCDEALSAGGDWQHQPEQRLRAALRESEAFQLAANDIERELMVADASKPIVRQWIAEHIADLPTLFIQRIITHWNPYTGKSLVWRVLILIGAVYLIATKRREAWILVGLPVMNTILVASMYTTGGRFLVPLYGVLFTLSAIGIALICEWLLRCLGLFAGSRPKVVPGEGHRED